MNTSVGEGDKKHMIEFEPGVLESMLESAGFEKIPDGMEISATFHLVEVYSLENIILTEIETNYLTDLCHKNEKDISFGFGNDLNKIFQYLLNEDFAEDQEKWIEDNETKSPFLVIHITLDKPFTCKSGYWRKDKIKDQEVISTPDYFLEARELLRKKASRKIPRTIASLSVHFSSLYQPVRFRKVFHKIYGKTKLREEIDDISLSELFGKFSISSLAKISLTEAKTVIEKSLDPDYQLTSQVSSLLYKALKENDKLKQFLNFFFVLEVHTNQVFKEINFQDYFNEVKFIPDRIKIMGEKSIKRLKKLEDDNKELIQRFYWCTLLAWENIDDMDIEDFISLKNIRDSIAHGDNVSEAKLPRPIAVAEKLCFKILSNQKYKN